MRRHLSLIAILALSLVTVRAVSPSALQKQLAGGTKITVIDVRSPVFFAQEHIPGAINIPAPLCPLKQLPPLGQVVVYGAGLGSDGVAAAAAALAAKPGLQVEILDGGFAGWKNTSAMTTRGAGLKRESFNYVSYERLKTFQTAGVVLYDVRRVPRANTPAVTDLNSEFPGFSQTHSRKEIVRRAATASAIVVLIDSGDGTAEKEARLLKSSGLNNYVILAGGEHILARHGQRGLQRNAGANPAKLGAGATTK